MPAAKVVIVGGVSGSGKTTVGTLLAQRLGWDYADADTFHTGANIAKMRGGTPLTDIDRVPWLRAIITWIDQHIETGSTGVITCSALKRPYRDMLTRGRPEVRFVLLEGDRDVIETRLRSRIGHFFDPALLDTQFAVYEPPQPGENIVSAPIDGTVEETVDHILKALDLSPASTGDA